MKMPSRKASRMYGSIMKARKTLLAGFAAILLAGAGSGGAVYLCIGGDGHVRLKMAEEKLESCCYDEIRAASAQVSHPQAGGRRLAGDADCCLDIPIVFDTQVGPFLPVRDPYAATPTTPSAPVDRVVEPLHLTTVPDPSKPPPSTNGSISSLRTVVLLV